MARTSRSSGSGPGDRQRVVAGKIEGGGEGARAASRARSQSDLTTCPPRPIDNRPGSAPQASPFKTPRAEPFLPQHLAFFRWRQQPTGWHAVDAQAAVAAALHSLPSPRPCQGPGLAPRQLPEAGATACLGNLGPKRASGVLEAWPSLTRGGARWRPPPPPPPPLDHPRSLGRRPPENQLAEQAHGGAEEAGTQPAHSSTRAHFNRRQQLGARPNAARRHTT